MVFESVVVDVLNKILGSYVENLDSKQLSLGIWGGDVVLQNLVLKQSALDELDIPIQIVYGRLGKLVLKIPWKNLYGAPVEVQIDKLFLLVVPHQQVKYNAEKEEKLEIERKQATLKRIEEAKKKAEEMGKPRDQANDTFVEKLTTQIIKNVQVKINNIHIRYEDSITNPGHPFAFGITLSNLSVATTDSQWQPGFSDDKINMIYKILNLEALSAYWNCSCAHISKMSTEEIISYCEENIASKMKTISNYNYVLGPINASARLRLFPKPENDLEPFSNTKMLLNLDMEKLSIGLNTSQFQDMLLMADSMNRLSRAMPYRKFRPDLTSYKGHYKEWWLFAYNCVLEQVRRTNRNWDWNHIHGHRQNCKTYASAYRTKLLNKKMTEEEKSQFVECEKHLDITSLVIIRQRIQMDVERLEKETEKKKSVGWFSSWWGGSASEEDTELSQAADLLKKFQKAMTPDEKNKLYRAIDYQENSAPAEFPEDYIATKCAFILRCLEITIKDDKQNNTVVLVTELKDVNCGIQQRPAMNAIIVAVKIDQFSVNGMKQLDVIPQMVTSEKFTEGGVLLDIFFETNPLDKKCNQRLHVKSEPLKIIYDAKTVIQLTNIFKLPEAITLDRLQEAAIDKFENIKELSTTGMQHMIEQHNILDLNMHLLAPYFILPYSGLYSSPKSVLILDMGEVKIYSLPRNVNMTRIKELQRREGTKQEIMEELVSESYDKFDVKLSNIQILIANNDEEWKTCILEQKITPMHILQPVNLTVNIQKCILRDERLPKIKICGQLPSITINMVEDRILNLIALFVSIPLPTGEQELALDNASVRSSRTSLTSIALGFDKSRRKISDKRIQSIEYDNITQTTELEAKFEMKEFALILSKTNVAQGITSEQKLIEFRCMLLELEMTQYNLSMDVAVKLGGIGLKHFRPVNTVEIIKTPMSSGLNEYLIVVHFVQVNKKHPEFHAKFGSCEQLLDLNFSTLQLELHQQSIEELLIYSSSFQYELNDIKSNPLEVQNALLSKEVAITTKKKKLEDISEVPSKIKPMPMKQRRHAKIIMDTIMFKFIARLKELNLMLSSDRRPIAEFAVNGIETEVILKKIYMEVSASLTDLVILDMNPDSIHKKILYKTDAEQALHVEIVIYNQVPGIDHNVDISIELAMSCIRITYLNLFVTTVLEFLNKFQEAQSTLKEATSAAAETAKLNMKNVYEKATRIKMVVNLNAPVIIIPINSTSYDGFMIDLGHMQLNNNIVQVDVTNEMAAVALIDEIKLHLKNIKMSRVTLDENLKNKVECNLLKPITFMLKIKRNLSVSWYNKIPNMDIIGELKSVELMLSELDYNKLLLTLAENVGEASVPHKVDKKPSERRRNIRRLASMQDSSPIIEVKDDPEENKQVHTSLRFSFAMENFTITLFRYGSSTLVEPNDCAQLNHIPENGLARITILVLSVKGRILTDSSITTSILLVDCLLDDIRMGRETMITRLMERKNNGDVSKQDNTKKSMIDITFQQKGLDIFVDVRVCGFNLILSMDYLMKISEFFSPPQRTRTEKPKHLTHHQPQPVKQSGREVQSCMTINLKVEEPDIILVEKMDDIQTNALILNSEMLFNIRIAGTNQSVRGSVSNLQLYTCCFNPEKRNETKYPVLRPCNIVVLGTTPQFKGLHVDVTVSEIYIAISPAVIDLLNAVHKTMYAVEYPDCDCEDQDVVYYPNLWDTQEFSDADYWFLKTEEGQDAMDIMGNQINEDVFSLQELCNFNISSLTVTIESGVGKKTIPMLLLQSKFVAYIRNWSSKLTIESVLSLQMEYFNQSMALWEPLIEPVETIVNGQKVHHPWQLKVELKMNEAQQDVNVISPVDSEIEELPYTQPAMCINVTSDVNLEVVVTKTLLEVLTLLSKAFSSVMKQGIPIQDANSAPYRLVNDTGIKITVELSQSKFKIFGPGKEFYKDIVLDSGTEIQLDTMSQTNKSFNTVAIHKSFSDIGITKCSEEIYLYVKANDVDCSLTIPVLRAVKRYFPLNHRAHNENWGIISDVTVEGSQTIITLRSILQVHNHFDQPVNIYYMTNRGNELEIIKQIPPRSDCNIPMNAAYTLTGELFLSVDGHSVSASPFVWKDLQHNLTMIKELMCHNIKNDNQIFIIRACGEIEQVFFDETTKHTMASTCYNIHLRPAIKFKNCLPIPVICVVDGFVNEYTVQPGEEMNLPNVNPGSSFLVFRLPNYLEKEWSCRQEIPSNPNEFTVWTFTSHDSVAKMILDLGMHCYNKHGTRTLSLYCPFWMLNKTGQMLSYKHHDDVNVLHHPEDFNQHILFSFTAKHFFGKKKASIKVGTGDWSDKFSIDVSGSSGTVVCKANNMLYQIGVHNQLTYNGLTKQVTFTPYYVLINNAPFVIECQELERPADPWIVIQTDACTPLWPRSERDDKLLKLRIGGTTEVSAPFLFTEAHTSLLKMNNAYAAVNVDVQVTEVGVYIIFSEYNIGLAPALVINHTDNDLRIWERESVNSKMLPSKHKFLHTWDNPTGPRLIVWETSEKSKEKEIELRKDELGEFLISDDTTIYYVTFLDGTQRVLLFTKELHIATDAYSAGDFDNIEQEITVSIHGIGLSLINNYIRQEIMYVAIASSGIIWEACKMHSKRYKALSVKDCNLLEAAYQDFLQSNENLLEVQIDSKTEVDFQNMLMLRPNKRKIRRGFQTGLWMQMKTSPHHIQLHAKINRVQIDNQIYDCIFPVILAPVPPPKTVAAESSLKPFAELSIVQRIMKHSPIQQYKYFKVLVQEFHIKVDLGFINALTTIFEGEEQSHDEIKQLFLKDISLANEPLKAHVTSHSQQEQKNFYDLLHFSPLKVHVSFSLATSSSATQTTATASALPEFLSVILQGVGVTLTDVNDIVFRIAYFERDYSFLSQKQLVSETTSHYVGQAIKQMYVLVFGLDVLGNPFGLVLGLTKGVEDLFYEPFQGAIQGPGEFAEGLALGVRSLFGHTVGGAAGAVSKITGAMGKGIAALTFDKDYQRKRRNMINKKPATLQEGIARGGKGLVMGVVDGVTGVFTKPVAGAKEQGVEGFFKGIGKGAVGLVTRPAGGIIDFASGSLDAVKRATEMGEDVIRVRAPRYIAVDGVIRPYVKSEADGFKLIRELDKGKYVSTDTYQFHTWIIEGKDILLLTDKRLAYVVRNEIFGGWQVDWSYTWSEIKTPAKVVDRGVQIQASTEGKKKVLGLFGSSDNGKIIIIGDVKLKKIITDKIESLRVQT